MTVVHKKVISQAASVMAIGVSVVSGWVVLGLTMLTCCNPPLNVRRLRRFQISRVIVARSYETTRGRQEFEIGQ